MNNTIAEETKQTKPTKVRGVIQYYVEMRNEILSTDDR